MAEPARPARVTDTLPMVPDHPDHVRVLVLCSCGASTDLTWKADLPPASVKCAGCGTDLELPGGGDG
jgi:hypothetical protein